MKPFKMSNLLTITLALVLGGTSAEAKTSRAYEGSATDFMAISQLFARYNAAVDNLDGRSWAATFTNDGVFQDTQRCVVGRSALEALVGSTPMLGRDRERFHIQSMGPIVYSSRDAAEVRSTILVPEIAKADVPPRNWLTAIAVDTLRKVDGHWLIGRRVVYKATSDVGPECP